LERLILGILCFKLELPLRPVSLGALLDTALASITSPSSALCFKERLQRKDVLAISALF
jgi:hypothetical protein